jgi:CRISPR-associated protein Csm3
MAVNKMTLQFQANFLIKGEIYCETGLHVGGTSEGIEIGGLENIVIRDLKTGWPFIPGSSLKGKMRSLLELSDMEASKNIITSKGEPCKCGKCIPCKIFGTPALEPKDKSEGRQQGPTRLIVRDCFPAQKIETELKFENTIKRITSEANPRPMERVPRGSTFKFDMVFSVYEEEDYANFLNIIHSMRLVEDNYLGGSGTRGYGQIKFKDMSIVKRSADYYKGKVIEKPIEAGKTISDIYADSKFIEKIKEK